jgi:hypothetical protein
MQKTIFPAEKKLRYACAAFSVCFYNMDFSDVSHLFCGLIISRGKEFQITRQINLFSQSNLQSLAEAISEEWKLPIKEVENHFRKYIAMLEDYRLSQLVFYKQWAWR